MTVFMKVKKHIQNGADGTGLGYMSENFDQMTDGEQVCTVALWVITALTVGSLAKQGIKKAEKSLESWIDSKI